MMRGIEFKYTKNDHMLISNLFEGIPLDGYDLYVSDSYFVEDNELDKRSYVSGTEFRELADEPTYIISINVQAYPIGGRREELKVYEDFINSECEIVFLVCDVEYVEIYTKDDNILRQFMKNAEEAVCEDLLIKTAENDGRTRLSVW